MNKTLVYIILATVAALLLFNWLHTDKPINLAQYELKQKYAQKHIASVDHSQFAILQQDFKTPQDVTEACLTCHNLRHQEIINSSHWHWDRISYVEGKGIRKLGKKNVLNNFCIGSTGNEQACAKCHIGFGMSHDAFDFENARNVDCMVCHDRSEEYIKGASMAGYPDRTVNLSKVAQHVGRPNKINCGACHFYSGGGNNVKHGDLEEGMLSCSRDVDVHMAANGINMDCVDCHGGENHEIKGKMYTVSSANVNRLDCTECHTSTPHQTDIINRHFSKVACQTCHIPEYAKINSTKMAWWWSEAGKMDKDGKPYHTEDSLGNHDYMSIKGRFEWGRNVQPEYMWFNGTAQHMALGDTVTEIPVQVNRLLGSAQDPHSKIYPVKVHRGNQIYDPVNNMLIQPRLYSPMKGDSAFWIDFDWATAAAAGMKEVGLPYSGTYEFVETEMYWPINHMVAPKDKALSCNDCHVRENGRLAKVEGFYLPGRDYNASLDFFGRMLIWLSCLGVVVHSFARFVSGKKRENL